jgi:hypothetical protein
MPDQSIIDALMGTWPARLGMGMLQGAMAPGRAYQSTPANPVTTEQMVEPAANLAGLAMTGAMPFGVRNAVGMGIKAYHGSPYDFDKFDLSKIGTGEGAQAYGHGLYFAENPKVAESYRSDPAMNMWTHGLNFSPVQEEAATRFYKERGAEGAIASLNDRINASHAYADTPESLKQLTDARDLLASGWMPPRGRMYEVNINADPKQFVNWDIPGQREAYNARLDSLLKQGPLDELGLPVNHQEAMNRAITQMASEGTPGLRYLDQGSRAAQGDFERALQHLKPAQERVAANPNDARAQDVLASIESVIKKGPHQTSNYVVFNPDIVEIMKKYSLAGAMPFGIGAMPFGTGNEQQQ